MTGPRDDWTEVRRRIDDLEARLRRGRLTVPTYLAGTAFFLMSGFVTGRWTPPAILALLCAAAAWISHHLRRRRQERLRALEALERSLPPENGGQEAPA